MKESYVEGFASYGGPKSCVHIREGVGEALTGVSSAYSASRPALVTASDPLGRDRGLSVPVCAGAPLPSILKARFADRFGKPIDDSPPPKGPARSVASHPNGIHENPSL